MRRSKTGESHILPRTGVASIYHNEYVRQFTPPVEFLRVDEQWNLTEYEALPRFRSTWENPHYTLDSPPNQTTEEWDLTEYLPQLVHIQPGYASVTEPWNISYYIVNLRIDEPWEEDGRG